jgi:hypothetical protein
MSSVSSSNMIEIEGIDAQHVGSARGDGTPGSGLYSVPVKLKQLPSPTWARLFPENWDHPPEWSTLHRPGIARVVGDTILLSATTIEEVRDVHTKTLRLAVTATNEQAAAIAERQRTADDRKTQDRAMHRANIRDVASEIRFDT